VATNACTFDHPVTLPNLQDQGVGGHERMRAYVQRAAPQVTAWHLVHESIYQAIYASDGTLGRERFTCLRTRRRRRPHWIRDARRAGSLREMTMIGDRPAEVEGRAVPGHWEGHLARRFHGRGAPVK